jgi:hypothetical protein
MKPPFPVNTEPFTPLAFTSLFISAYISMSFHFLHTKLSSIFAVVSLIVPSNHQL